MVERMQVGLWGCGGMGNLLARSLLATDEAELGVVYDVRPEATAQAASRYGARAMGSAETLLSHPGLDGVMIALPSYLHADAVVQAAEAGVDVFCEKPMALTAADCERMIAAAQAHGVRLMIGHVLRYYEPYCSILRWQAEGRLGTLFAVSIWRFFDGRRVAGKGSWQAVRAQSGGYLFEIGAHELDMLRCALGQPESVCAVAQKVLPRGHEMEDHIAIQVRYPGGHVGLYECGTGVTIGRYGFCFYFEGATLISEAALDPRALQAYDREGREIDALRDEFSEGSPEQAELQAWLSALRDEAPVPIPGEEGLATVALIEATLRSAEGGELVSLR